MSSGQAARTSTAAATASGAIDDTWITTTIRSKYFMDGDVQASRIEVDTRNGVVTLTGTAGSKEAKDAVPALTRGHRLECPDASHWQAGCGTHRQHGTWR